MTNNHDPKNKPINPYWVLLMAIILPGVGHLLLRETERAVMFGFFTLLLGAITFQLTTPEHSFLGRYAGGLFIYALSLTDAYRLARIRYESARLQSR